jgi:hypothetical protein
MKKMILLSALFLVGLSLFLMNRTIGAGIDRMLFDHEIRLTEANSRLEKGDMDGHEKGLTEYVLTEGGSMTLRAIALYNLGNCALARAAQGDPAAGKDALYYFREALRNDPLLFPAKFNLEILTRSRSGKDEQEGEGEAGPETARTQEETEDLEEGVVFPPPFLGSTP